MKKLKRLFAVATSLAVVFSSFCVFADEAEKPDPTFFAEYHSDAATLAEIGQSEVAVPYHAETDELGFPLLETTLVDNSFKFLMINGTLEKDASIFTVDGFTLVPLRLVSDRIGAAIDYDAATKEITVKKGETEIRLIPGEKKALVNGAEIDIDTAAIIDDGTTYVPIRFVTVNLGGKADYITNYLADVQSFPTVVIDSMEFADAEKMSDDEALALVRERLVESAVAEFEQPPEELGSEALMEYNAGFAKLKADMENPELAGPYASCYIIIKTENSIFIVNKINGDMFTLSGQRYSTRLKPFEPYDVGNTYFFN